MIVKIVQDGTGRSIKVGDVVDGKNGIHGEVVTIYEDTDLVQVKIGDNIHRDVKGIDVMVVTADPHDVGEVSNLIQQLNEAREEVQRLQAQSDALVDAFNAQLMAINEALAKDAGGLSVARGEIDGAFVYQVVKPVAAIAPTSSEAATAATSTPIDGASTVHAEADAIPAAADALVDGTTVQTPITT